MDSQTERAAVGEVVRPGRQARLIVVGATALTVILIATVVYLRTNGAQPFASLPSHPTPRSSPIPPSSFVFPVSPSTAYVLVGPTATSPAGVFLTVDTGKVWRHLLLPIPKSEHLAAANLLEDGKLLLESWDESDQQQTHAYVGDGVAWTEVKVPIQGGGWPRMLDSRVGFYFVSGKNTSTGEHDLTIFRTVDSGNHWDRMLQLDRDHSDAGGLSIAEDHFVGFTDATHGWLVSTAQPYAIVCGPTGWTPAGRLLASEDGGQHWTERRLPPLPDGSAQLGPPVMIRGSAGYMLASVQPYTGKCPPDPVEFAYSTTDGGTTWTPPKRLPTELMSTVDGIDWWATDGMRLLRSRDQGTTWSTKVARLPARDVMLGDLAPVGGDTAWSMWTPAVDQTGHVALLRTSDGGATWSEVKLPPQPG